MKIIKAVGLAQVDFARIFHERTLFEIFVFNFSKRQRTCRAKIGLNISGVGQKIDFLEGILQSH